jgi:hypothetical protein
MMKKATVLIILSVMVMVEPIDAQQIYTSNVTMYYGTKKKVGFDFMTGEKLVYGAGFVGYIGKGAVGKDYSETIGSNTYREDIYEIIEADNLGVYALIGSRISKYFTIAAKLGFATRMKYYNGYDRQQILAPDGYWYTAQKLDSKALIGAFAQINADRWSPYFGVDNFSGVKIGLGYNF